MGRPRAEGTERGSWGGKGGAREWSEGFVLRKGEGRWGILKGAEVRD